MTIEAWLLRWGYPDVVASIRQVRQDWKQRGVRTRRDWWETLAGDKHGRPRTVGGITFPVLVAAQRLRGRKVTPNAIQRDPNEETPEKVYHGSSLTRLRCAGGCVPAAKPPQRIDAAE